MNALLLLMGLLLLSYIGSFLVGGRASRGGLASGGEYLVLGFVVGPAGLGLLERSTLDAFEPIASVALGWLAFVFGLTHGIGERERPRIRIVAGWLLSLVSGSIVALAAWFVLAWRSPLAPGDRLLVAGGVGAACAETTRYAARWVVERYRARGPVSDLVGDLFESGDLIPLLAAATLFATRPTAALPAGVALGGWIAITLVLGAVLGGMAALLLGKTFEVREMWGVLLGMSMLAIGTSSRLGLSTMAAMFIMGATLSALSPHRAQVAAVVAPTERPVMLPALVLAGAHVAFGSARWLPWLIAAALVARVVAKLIAGLGMLAASRAARPAGPRLGLGLLPAGALATSIGLSFALRFPGSIGDAVLATAAIVVLFGELAGTVSLRAALGRVGEIPEEPAEPSPPPAPAESGEARVET